MLISLFLCLAAWSVTPSASAPVPTSSVDIIPDGVKFVDVERIRELDPLREYCCVQYMIQKGDTFYGIARRETGRATPAAIRELRTLNPDVDPKRLRIGQRIWLPPKKTSAGRRFVYLSTWPGDALQGSPFAFTDRIYARYGTFRIQIVEGEHNEEYLKTKSHDALQAMEKDGKLQLLEGQSFRGMVDEDSDIASMKERIAVQRDKEGKFTLECSVQHFDKEGRLIVPEKPGAPGKKKKDGRDELWLLLLGLGGAGFVFFLAHRRARSASLVPAV